MGNYKNFMFWRTTWIFEETSESCGEKQMFVCWKCVFCEKSDFWRNNPFLSENLFCLWKIWNFGEKYGICGEKPYFLKKICYNLEKIKMSISLQNIFSRPWPDFQSMSRWWDFAFVRHHECVHESVYRRIDFAPRCGHPRWFWKESTAPGVTSHDRLGCNTKKNSSYGAETFTVNGHRSCSIRGSCTLVEVVAVGL